MGAQVYINEDEREALKKAWRECRNLLEGTGLDEYHDSHGDVPEHLRNILRKVRRRERRA